MRDGDRLYHEGRRLLASSSGLQARLGACRQALDSAERHAAGAVDAASSGSDAEHEQLAARVARARAEWDRAKGAAATWLGEARSLASELGRLEGTLDAASKDAGAAARGAHRAKGTGIADVLASGAERFRKLKSDLEGAILAIEAALALGNRDTSRRAVVRVGTEHSESDMAEDSLGDLVRGGAKTAGFVVRAAGSILSFAGRLAFSLSLSALGAATRAAGGRGGARAGTGRDYASGGGSPVGRGGGSRASFPAPTSIRKPGGPVRVPATAEPRITPPAPRISPEEEWWYYRSRADSPGPGGDTAGYGGSYGRERGGYRMSTGYEGRRGRSRRVSPGGLERQASEAGEGDGLEARLNRLLED